MKTRNDKGFTLIELLIVVAIIAVITAIAAVSVLRSRAAANEASAIASIRVTSSSQKAYAVSCGFGAYATGYVVLGTAVGTNDAYISADLAIASPTKAAGGRCSSWSRVDMSVSRRCPFASTGSTWKSTARPRRAQ